MGIVDLLSSYKSQVTSGVSQETQLNTLDPDIIGSIGTDLADILLSELPKQNRFDIDSGAAHPIGGADTDLYYKSVANGLQVYRNINGAWTLLTTIPIGIALPDGVLVGLRTSISTTTVTVSRGAWIIDNVKYNKDTQTEFTLAPKNASFDRWDLVYADKNNAVLIQTGVAALVPVKPAIPANCIDVDYVYVPSVNPAYLLTGQSFSATSPAPIPAFSTSQSVDGLFILNWDASKVSQFGLYGRFLVEQLSTYQSVPIKINKSNTGLPISYEFNLSNIDSLIHII